MDPKLTEQLQQLLAALLANVQDGATWAKGQIPLLVQEKIAFGRVEETAWFLASVVIAGLLIRMSARFWRRSFELAEETDAPIFMAPICGYIAALMVLAVNFHNAALVWFAPRLYVVEWLIGMTKK